MGEPLSMWTVYDSPLDAQGRFVARRWEVRAGEQPWPTSDLIASVDLEQVRRYLRDTLGLHCLPRDADDDPVIVETWL